MTAEEYEAAVDVIVRAVRPHREKLSTPACRAEQVEIVQRAILKGTYPLEAAIDAGIGGDPFVDRALRLIAQQCLSEGVIPEPLSRFVHYVLGSAGPANFPKGQHSLNFWSRNSAIRILLEETKQQWGLDSTRNEATEGPAAATIIADALTRCGIKIGENQIAAISRGK